MANTKENKLIEEIKKRVAQAKDAVSVSLNPDDPDLIHQISLGDEWDEPSRMAEALDMHPLWYARWASLLKTLKNQRDKLQARYKTWESISKEELYEQIFQEAIDSGMTANNAKPTGPTVDRRFEKLYGAEKIVEKGEDVENFHDIYLSYKKPLESIIRKIDTVQVVVDAFDVRTQMLIQLGGLLRSLMDNKVLITKKK